MKFESISLKETGYFSKQIIDYLDEAEALKSFYNVFPLPANFMQVIQKRDFSSEKREILVNALRKQYKDIEISPNCRKNLELLESENTYTITTGHQLNVFTGPLYFIYKIISAINTAKQLNETYPDFHFVPVYWMASEDHDFEEIKSFHLFGKTYSWKTNQGGAVGRMDPGSINELIDSLPEKPDLFVKAYLESTTLSEATRKIVHGLFPDSGLVVIDADDPGLKGLFKEVIKDDLINHRANDLVEESSAMLADLGYKAQVYPRAINFFYLDDQIRERIVEDQGRYSVLNQNLTFSKEQILDLADNHPEKFSPNVILRPLYQEMILPNLAYIGGPAEVSYWFQLKKVFDHFEAPFPVIMPRNFAMVLTRQVIKKIEKLGLQKQSLFLDMNKLKKKYLDEHTQFVIDLVKEIEILNQVYESILNKSNAVDKSLEGFVASERAKTLKSLDKIEKRLAKSEEQNQETGLKQVENTKERLFPSGNLQERHDNMLNFYLNNPGFIKGLEKVLDPFKFEFYLISPEE